MTKKQHLGAGLLAFYRVPGWMRKKVVLLGLIIMGVGIIFRLALPTLLLPMIEKKLNSIPGYKAEIESLNISLYRGSYQIRNVRLIKIDTHLPVPFFSAESVEFNVEWRALLHGRLVAQVKAVRPVVNFVVDPAGNNEQLTINDQWRVIVTKLFPLPFNQILIINGEIYFRSYNSKPPFTLYLQHLAATLNNLSKVTRQSTALFSDLAAEGETMDGAKVALHMQFDPSNKQPTFLLKAELVKLHVKEANDFLQHYTHLKASQGLFSLYVEAAAARGKITGYVKPLFKNLKIASPSNTKLNPLEHLYKGAAQLITAIVENPKHKTVATKIKLSGNINNPNVNLFSVIGYLLRHAFIQALLPGIDHSVKMQDIILDL